MIQTCYFGINTWSAWYVCKNIYYYADPAGRSECPAPDISFLPVVLRKRLSLYSKTGLWLADKVFNQSELDAGSVRSVFASRYADYSFSYAMMSDLNRGETVSPAAFSGSVHNALSGRWSIASGNKTASTTIAAGIATFYCGLLEAANTANECKTPILYIYTDTPLPDVYRQWDGIGSTTGFAALVIPDVNTPDEARFKVKWGVGSDCDEQVTANSQIENTVHFLIQGDGVSGINDGRLRWEFSHA